MAAAPKGSSAGGKKKPTACQQKAAHRAAQAKYVAKAPAKQTARVQKSQSKTSTQAKGAKTAGAGKHGSTQGRPRKAC